MAIIENRHASVSGSESSPSQIKVLRNTYFLLSLTLSFSAAVALISAWLVLPSPGLVLTLIGYFGLLYFTQKNSNRASGVAWVFALTGFMGYTLGPILGAYWSLAPPVVMQAFGGTALIFFALSAYALTTRKRFSFLSSFLFVGILVAFVAGLASVFFNLPSLSLAVSAMFVLLMSGLILYQTGEIVNGGETNYIMATVTLFVSIYNLFTSLLHLLSASQSE